MLASVSPPPRGTSVMRLRGRGLDELGRYLRLILTSLAGTNNPSEHSVLPYIGVGGEVPDSVAVRGFGASQGNCDPVKVTRPKLRIESGILRT